jgi:signal transduction histidine kinase
MRLPEFIHQNHAEIGQAWEQFARALTTFAQGMNLPSLRDDLDAILQAIVEDMERPEDTAQQAEKEKGEGAPGALEQITDRHARTRLKQGFNLRHVTAEYRALRASILTLYAQSGAAGPDLGEVIRFNEAIDQAIAEILRHHEKSVTQETTRFLAILAHDIRNPLNAINLAAEALERQGVPTAVERIRRGVRQASRLVDDLAIFVRQRTGNALPLSKSATDLRLLCEQVLEDARGKHANRAFNLIAQGDLRGSWDSDRLVQVIENLVGNAAAHGAAPEVEVEIRDDGQSVVLKVTSQGNPIPADKLDSIFDPMVRTGPSSGTSLSGGLGLGLFIVREIVTAHAGTVEVISSPEDGTTFTIRLPR